MLRSKVGSWPYPKTLGQAEKACQGKTFLLITNISKLWEERIYNFGSCSIKIIAFLISTNSSCSFIHLKSPVLNKNLECSGIMNEMPLNVKGKNIQNTFQDRVKKELINGTIQKMSLIINNTINSTLITPWPVL